MRISKSMIFLSLLIVLTSSYSILQAASFEELAYYWSPTIYHDVDTKWERRSVTDRDGSGKPENGIDDFITKFDFDGNFDGDDNWENLKNFESKGLHAYVYYSVAETETHWFLFYAIYHPRDWDDELSGKVFNKTQHENDLEGLMLVVRRDAKDFGSIQAINTFAHGHWFNYPVPGSNIEVKGNFNDDRSKKDRPKFDSGSHVIIYIQSEGHGIYADKLKPQKGICIATNILQPDINYWEQEGFPYKTGVKYSVGDKAEVALPINEGGSNYNQHVHYKLLSINELWEKRYNPKTFVNGKYFLGKHDGYGDNDEYDDKNNNNICAAPWAFMDKSGCLPWEPTISLSPQGQAFTDPASFIWNRYSGFDKFSFDYTANNPPWIIPAKNFEVVITSIDPSNFPEIKAYTTVENLRGESITDLGASNFKVYEDKTKKSSIRVSSVGAEFVSSSICIIMDTSGSMSNAIGSAKDAAIAFVNNMKPHDKAALINFREYVTIAQTFIDDKNILIGAIKRLYADGYTAFYDAVYKGIGMISTQPGIRAIVALTDGMDNRSIKTAKDVIDYAKSISVPVYIVGLVGGDGLDERTLRLIANETEGRYYQTPKPGELLQLYESISERLKNLYEISYTTHNQNRDRSIRSVTVEVVQNEVSGQYTGEYKAPGLAGGISGIVLDRKTGEPIKSTTILIDHDTSYFNVTDASVNTNEKGEYLVENLASDFKYRVTASALGYHKSSINSVAVGSFRITENISFNLQPVDSYFDAKYNLIKEFRDNEKIYKDEETMAERFLVDIKEKGELATDQEKEALQRLYLAESFANEAYMDSKRLAQLGTNGLGGFFDIGIAVISVCGGVGETLKKVPFIGDFLASPYIAAKNEMVNLISTKSYIFLNQNYDVTWTLKSGIYFREAIGKSYDKIIIFANKELATKPFNDAMAEVHKFIEKEFFLGLYELITANFMDKSVKWAGSSPPVFRVGRLSSARNRVNQIMYDMNISNDEKIKRAELAIWVGDTIGTAGAVASGVMLAGGAVLSALGTKSIVGAPLASVLIPLSTKIAVATSAASGGLKVGATAAIAQDLWSTIPNYVKDAIAYSYDSPTSDLAAPSPSITQEYAGLLAPSRINMPLMMPSTIQYPMGDYNFILKDIYDYIQNDKPEKVQEILESLIKSGNTFIGNINVGTAQIVAASPNTMGKIADYDAMYSKFELDLSRAASERINLYSLLTLYLANPNDASIKELLALQIGTTMDANNELEESLADTTQALIDARVTIPTLVIVKNFSTPDVIPQGKPFAISALVQNIGQIDASKIALELSVPKGSGLTLLERSKKSLENLGPGEEQIISWELEYTGRKTSVESGVNIATVTISSESDLPDFTALPPTYILLSSPPPTPSTGGKLFNLNVYAYPNPFNPDTESVNIRYSLSNDANITIEIYDSNGELVTTLINKEPKEKTIEYSESWNGKNDRNDVVANGVYFYLITASTGENAVGKIAVLR